jgi:DNA-binding NarL/FixJ family response regulator
MRSGNHDSQKIPPTPSVASSATRPTLSQPPKTSLTPQSLTGREVGVLRLVAQGQSNREIAEQLVITEMTVRTHVSNILSKLHLASRTQAALYAPAKDWPHSTTSQPVAEDSVCSTPKQMRSSNRVSHS